MISDYLSCNRDKFTTTQLVSAGIGVTLLIFVLAFTVLWLMRRRRKPVKSKTRKVDEEQVKAVESEDEERTKPLTKHLEAVNENQSGSTGGEAVRGDRRPISRAVTVQDESEDPTSQLQPPTLLTVPSQSRRSSRIGSPTEPPSTRQLYPSNPDPRNSLKPPTRPQRPPSSQWLAASGHEGQPPMPPPRYSSRPPTSSHLGPRDSRASFSRSPSPSASRRVSSIPTQSEGHLISPHTHTCNEGASIVRSSSTSATPPILPTPGQQHSAQPASSSLSPHKEEVSVSRSPSPSTAQPIASGPITQADSYPTTQVIHQRPIPVRSASMHSNGTSQTDYNDMPLPVPPPQPTGNRPLPARSSSRGSVGSKRQTSFVPTASQQPVPTQRPLSVHPLGQDPISNPTPATATAATAATIRPAQASTPNANAAGFTAGIGVIRQSVSTQTNPVHGRAASVSVSVHEGDPGMGRADGRKSTAPGPGKQATVEDEDEDANNS